LRPEDRLEEAIERIKRGENREKVLSELGRDLEPLIDTVLKLERIKPAPRPEFKEALRMKLPVKRGYFKKLAISLAIALFILASITGVVFASDKSEPGNILYPVKIAKERVMLVFSRDKLPLHVSFVGKRVEEFESIAGKMKPPVSKRAYTAFPDKRTSLLIRRLETHLDKIEELSKKAEDKERALEILQKGMKRDIRALKRIYERVPPARKGMVIKVLSLVKKKYEEAIKNLRANQ